MSNETELRRMLQEVADKNSISKVISLHSRGVDRADREMLKDAYHPDADLAYGLDVQSAIDFLAEGQFSHLEPHSMHRSGTPWIKVDGDTAISETYVIARLEDHESQGVVQREVAGRYLDRHAKLNGEWRIVNRMVVLDWNRNRPGGTNWPTVSEGHFMPIGGHRAADPGRTLLAAGRARFALNEIKGDAMMTRSLEALADELASKQDLHELLMAFSRGTDRADEELMSSVFHSDAVVLIGQFNGLANDYISSVANFVRTKTKASFHSIANEWFEVSGSHAVGESYVIIYSIIEQDGVEHDDMSAGRYVDTFERRDGVWKISQRIFVLDWQRIEPISADYSGMLKAVELPFRGKANREDLIYSFWNGG